MKRLRHLLISLRDLLHSLYMMVIIYLPGNTGIALRRWYYRPRFRACGDNLTILPGVQLRGLQFITIGDDVMIRENTIIATSRKSEAAHLAEERDVIRVGSATKERAGYIDIGDQSRIAHGVVMLGYGGIAIGKQCGIGPGVKIFSESYHYKGRRRDVVYKYSQGAPAAQQCVLQGAVTLKDGAGLASNVIVLPGATVGADAWVLPQSVVKVLGTVPDGVIAKGDPAIPVFDRPFPVTNHRAAVETEDHNASSS